MNTLPNTFELLPIYHWRGVRPWLFDLPPDHVGWLICLCFQRDGDLCFVPLAGEQAQHTADDQRNQYTPLPHLSPQTQSRQQQSIAQTVAALQQEGWHVHGRFTIHFTGRDTTLDFDQQTNTYLWQQPAAHPSSITNRKS